MSLPGGIALEASSVLGALPGEGLVERITQVIAITIAVVTTAGLGAFGLRRARTTSDFFVASRTVRPTMNASAICGEYLSAASFLGVAGLVMKNGIDQVWYPMSYAAGYLVLLFFVAAPLRRFGAYTIADFAEGRLSSVTARRMVSALVVLVSVAYMVPQLRGAGITLRVLVGAPYWAGVALVAVVVTANVVMGGMRGITFVQAFQYWLKLAAIAVPTLMIGAHFLMHRTGWTAASGDVDAWSQPVRSAHLITPEAAYSIPSIVVAQLFGVLGLPHILVRFYTNSDGRAARRTTLLVLALLGAFYVFPPVMGALGRLYAPDLLASGSTDTVVLLLPQKVFHGLPGEVLTGLVSCGAFAAFLSTASGLMVSAAGAISQDLLGGEKRDFQVGSVGVGVIIALLGFRAVTIDINQLVSWVFTIAASSFSPLIVLGIWWRNLSAKGAVVGLAAGALAASGSVAFTLFGPAITGWPHALLAQPALWSIPLGFTTMVVVSRMTPGSRPQGVSSMLLSMHAPESLGLNRSFR